MTTRHGLPTGPDPDFSGVTCPDCESSQIELVSLFGGSTSEVLFLCTQCRSCFNWVKWEHRMPPLPTRAGRAATTRGDTTTNLD
jgi:ribosomal protein S27E